MKDLIGQQFGKWIVLEFSYRTKDYQYYWKCQCECGTIKDVHHNDLKYGKSTQCRQCFYKNRKNPKKQNLIDRFNKCCILDSETGCWLWLRYVDKDGSRHCRECNKGRYKKYREKRKEIKNEYNNNG